jgi:hypothetical protein
MSQPQLSSTRRLILWGGLLAALSLVDFTLTAIALSGFAGAEEINPLAALAFEQGLATAFVLKLLAIEIVVLIGLAIAPTPFARTVERVMILWCGVFLIVNACSALQLLGVV